MRAAILKRIEELKGDHRYNAWRLFEHKRAIYYGKDESFFATMSDEELLVAFERIVKMAYRCY